MDTDHHLTIYDGWLYAGPGAVAAVRKRIDSDKRDNYKKTAYRIYQKALRGKIITRPDSCSACGRGDTPIHGHHEDYSKPLDVKWLCEPCHWRRHKDISESRGLVWGVLGTACK